MVSVQKIEIIGFREKNYTLNFIDGRLILVGENGAGKTTILQIVQNLLVCRWDTLSDFEFKSCEILFSDKTKISIDHSELIPDAARGKTFLAKHLSYRAMQEARNYIAHGDLDRARFIISHNSELPPWEIDDILTDFSSWNKIISFGTADGNSKRSRDLLKKTKLIKSKMDTQVVYLPTYRRIEKEIDAVLKLKGGELARAYKTSKNKQRDSEYLELVEFGMGDVQELVSKALKGIRDFQLTQSLNLSMAHLSDIVRGEFGDEIDYTEIAIDDSEIDSVLSRIDRSILKDLDTEGIKDTVKSSIRDQKNDRNPLSIKDSIVLSYFNKLFKFHNELNEKEKSIKAFCRVCESFMERKEFGHNILTGSLNIKEKEKEISLQDLSSGEKQIVSLFCHLLLSENKSFFVIVDEPELSLSVPWQRKFLEKVSRLESCSGLLAVTHSPFIYDNSLRQYTRSIGQLISSPDWGNISEEISDE